MCVTSFDSDTMAGVLGSASRRATLVEALGEQVDAYGGDGVNVEFEGLPESSRDELVAVVGEPKDRVGAVWLATHAVDWGDAWDYAALAEAGDGLFIMGYGYHWTGGGAGPNAPLEVGDTWSPWTLSRTAEDYLGKGTDPARVVLGLPSYGQAWPVSDSSDVPADTTGDGSAVVYEDAVVEAEAWGRAYDEVSDTPWYAPSATEQVWYDDPDCLEVKMRWAVQEQGFAGVGFWAIGYDAGAPAFWDAVDAATQMVEEDTGSVAGEDSGTPPSARVLGGGQEEAGGCGFMASGAWFPPLQPWAWRMRSPCP